MADDTGRSSRAFPWARTAPAGARRAAAAGAADWRDTLRSRVAVCAVLFGLWTVAIEARLIYLQVLQHEELTARADRQHLRTLEPPAKRGELLDRHGRVLAYSVDADSICAVPSEVQDPERAAELICGALERCSPSDRRRMAERMRRKGHFAYVMRQVSPDEARRVKALALEGIFFLKENRRFYPKRELAAHVLGYVGIDNTGLGGIESAYDAQISGRRGKVLIQADARRHVLFSREERPATAGAALELTIDQYLQHIAERELRAGVEEFNAAGGTALIMQPHTGEILALANWPTFNPNTFARAEEEARRNRAVQDLYEPGSTFKVVTAAGALEERVIDPADPIDCSPGYITFGRRVIRDVHRYGVLPFTDVFVKSSNVGVIKVGQRLGAERLGRYVSRFGFGQPIAPDFRGENPGIVWNPARLDASALASVSMGYQIGVTPLQMAAAVSSIANGGVLYEPRVVRAFIRDGRRLDVPHKALRRTVSPATAAELTAMMEAVVERGTAKAARLEGYTIAGKTGTAAKLVDGRYSKSEYNASFVGFVPSRGPELTIVVVIDSPRGRSYYGGAVAAPIFHRIADAALRHLGIPRTLNPPPPVLVARRDSRAAAAVSHPVKAPAVLLGGVEPAQAGLMPDVLGASAREALRTLARVGLSARISGDGFVVEQSPAAGTTLAHGEVCELTLARAPAAAGGGGWSR